MKTKDLCASSLSLILVVILATAAFSQSGFGPPVNLGPIVNSSSNDLTPVMAPNGLSLYFTSDRPGGGSLGGNDIWVTHRATLESAWGAPQNVTVLNTSMIDTITGFSTDGRTMLINSNRTGSLGANDIYQSQRIDPNDDFSWSVPVNLGPPVNTNFAEIAGNFFVDPVTRVVSLIFARSGNDPLFFNYYQSTQATNGSRTGIPTYSMPTLIEELNDINGIQFGTAIRADGLEIYITSVRPGGLNYPATMDLWVSTRASVSVPWTAPVLVPGINSVDEERNAKLSPDAAVMFFGSNRPGGSGGYDVYFSSRCSLYLSSPCLTSYTDSPSFKLQ